MPIPLKTSLPATAALVLAACATTPAAAPAPEAAPATPPAQSGQSDVLPLENTYWQLTSLGGQPVGAGNFGRQAHLVLQSGEHRLGGSGGCNSIMGSYSLENGELRIGQIASTLMMCPEGMTTEHDFLQALPRTVRWEVVGRQLTLRDAGGGELAAFSGHEKF